MFILAFLVAFAEAATEEGHAERLLRAKRASEGASKADVLNSRAFSDHSLLLLPISEDVVGDVSGKRWKREISSDSGNSSSKSEGKKKYHRLAHSLHVQSDIRYR